MATRLCNYAKFVPHGICRVDCSSVVPRLRHRNYDAILTSTNRPEAEQSIDPYANRRR